MALDDTQQADELDSAKRAAELQARFAALAERDDGGVEQRQRRAAVEAALFDEPIASTKIGRFTIVRKLGAGGMGVVYVAYDEQLDRRVAVKLLRNTVASSEGRVRLEREAQVMARLSHPNVVTVHEVGIHDEQVFMAMEFVDGEDLRQWLTRTKHDWREVLAVFLQAGEGLAAAHEAGVVHRDFKPDNVLVGNDGRVRVADFGLANSYNLPPDLADPATTESQRNRLGVPLTRPGAVLGTPAYMAPEQFRGATIDARADQFSFCVALWEGLYGTRPFGGNTLLELSMEVAAGKVASPPQDSAVPTWLREVMLRALAADPSARWDSMREMLDVLARDPEARRRRIMLALSLGLAVLVTLAGLIGLAASGLHRNARQRYWNSLTEQLLEIERERGLAQANDDARRARDSTRMNVVRSYRPKHEIVERHDPALAVALLREVEGDVGDDSEWISTANELLGQPLAHAVLQGHRGAIVPVLFAPDGAWLYTGSDDGEVWRWAVPSGVGERIVSHGKAITELALSPDGRLLASSAQDGSVRLWSTDSGESRSLERHRLAVKSIAFSPDGRRLASASNDGTVKIHELDSGRTSVLRADGGEVNVVAFAADGTRVLTGSQDGRARVWSLTDADGPVQVLEGHGAPIFLARMLDDGRALTGSDDGTARVWQLDGEPSGTIVARHAHEITALDVHGSRLATASVDGTILISSLDAPHVAISLPAHDAGVWSLAFTPDGAWLASGSFDRTARLTRSDGRGVPKVFVGHGLSIYDVALDPSGRWLATGSYDSTVRLWDVQRPSLATRLVGHDEAVRRVRVDTTSDRILTASSDGSVRIWSARDGTALARLPGEVTLFDAAFSPDGERVATGAFNGDVVLWSVTGTPQHRLVGHDKPVWQVCFDASGARVASASLDGTARIWSAETGSSIAVLRGHEGPVFGVDFDRDGAQLVTASHDGTVRVWDAASGEVEHILRGHTGKISVLTRSPDGHTLATGSDDGSARLWSTDWTGEPLTLAGHGKEIQSISFDASGHRLLTTCADHRARVWDTRDGTLLRVLEGHSNVIWDGALLPDDRVVTASTDGSLRIWPLDDDAPPLILTGHGSSGVLDVAVIDGGRRLVSGATDGTARLWQLDLLLRDPDQLRARLEAATNFCPSVEHRIHELGHDEEQAALGYAACERSHGR
ncbi:MAG TPA: protein kinase [Enhygromyxa sp.]|nr:protein kinase [Enhygromyxa sp.]